MLLYVELNLPLSNIFLIKVIMKEKFFSSPLNLLI